MDCMVTEEVLSLYLGGFSWCWSVNRTLEPGRIGWDCSHWHLGKTDNWLLVYF